MCGVSGIFGSGWQRSQVEAMVVRQHHRGPDAHGVYVDPAGGAALGHNRLSVIDLSEAGRQPMSSPDGRFWIAFNGEVYNYRELRAELRDYPFRSQTDTEVVLAAFLRWGIGCLDRLVGMFAFLVWDEVEQRLFAARDRLGVKPLYYHQGAGGSLWVASEIKALHAAGVPTEPDVATWATYLGAALYDHSERTFWRGVQSLPQGHFLTWQGRRLAVRRWYDLPERIADEWDTRPLEQVEEEYVALLRESVGLRFRADVPVGINLSGGLDSSILLALVQLVQGEESDVRAYTFATGDPAYDELPWVQAMLARTRHPSVVCRLAPEEVPALAAAVQAHQDEPFGGLPTLAYAKLFEQARADGTVVLLDGQGMDEQWAGYDYYLRLAESGAAPLVQGARDRSTRPECLVPEFRSCAAALDPPARFPDGLRNVQYRDAWITKIPRALRFNDRISMRCSVELREPFLDHRLFELALRQPPERKIVAGESKWLLRHIASRLLPRDVATAPKRALQTPQREWLRGELRAWADGRIEVALDRFGGEWLDPSAVRRAWREYAAGAGDNSFFVWQWVNLGLMLETTDFR